MLYVLGSLNTNLFAKLIQHVRICSTIKKMVKNLAFLDKFLPQIYKRFLIWSLWVPGLLFWGLRVGGLIRFCRVRDKLYAGIPGILNFTENSDVLAQFVFSDPKNKKYTY